MTACRCADFCEYATNLSVGAQAKICDVMFHLKC